MATSTTERPSQAKQYFQDSYGHFIGGEWVGGSSGRTIAMINPSTGEHLSNIQAGNAADAVRAIDAAAAAFPAWSKTNAFQRQALFLEISSRLKRRLHDFAMMETIDNGKPIRDSLNFDLPATIGLFDYYAGAAFHLHGETSSFETSKMLVQREPLGVCVQIIPWNVPLMMTALKIAPALITGNTVVLKPAETSCLAVMEFFREIEDLLPPGVVNLVTGYGPDVGEALVTDPRVRKVAFTGSKPTARQIIRYASENIIPQTMELGGKSASIVCEDADIELAVEGAVHSTIFNKGEVCISGSRVFVHRAIHDRFVERFAEVLAQVRQGDPTDPATHIGPQASKAQFDKVSSYLRLAEEEGTVARLGGRTALVPGFEKGYFIQPTILTGVSNDMRVAREEIFGPVTCIIPWDSEDEVLRLANDSTYGLGGGLWTRDLARAHRMADQMQTGTVWINRYYNFVPGQPLGGYKESGFGREGTLETLRHYTQTKAVVINLSDEPLGLFSN